MDEVERTLLPQASDPLASRGRVHSVESMGTVDGPGCRMVVFLQGCPLRCAYCHNPDSWDYAGGSEASVGELLERFERNHPFYRRGGMTVSGGEPLAQPRFVADLFRAAHRSPRGRIHCCLDTSGATFDPKRPEPFSPVLAECDLVLLDIKHSDPAGHRRLCGSGPEAPLALADELARRRIPMVVRHVVVPGITDVEEELRGLGRLLGNWDNVVGLDLLPYHTMGRDKYGRLGLPYRLEGVPAMDPTRLPELRAIVMEARAARRAERVR
ncbi:pyruvate formate-lyase-activating protein [Olsenella phocaeensis]|uniref:pyruvate formate-lyase-activating protein n=1 Tax=Olsenella phocaeensis TaxID=1852385 RepID=UPI000930DF8D|nr:pyruvate formate-lyase-activating protein [Olsenella phocaeensis]